MKLHTFLKTCVGSTIAFYLAGHIICDQCKTNSLVLDPALDLSLPLKYDRITEDYDFTTINVFLPEGCKRNVRQYDICIRA